MQKKDEIRCVYLQNDGPGIIPVHDVLNNRLEDASKRIIINVILEWEVDCVVLAFFGSCVLFLNIRPKTCDMQGSS